MLDQTTVLVGVGQAEPGIDTVSGSCPAHLLLPHQRQDLALQILVGSQPVAQLARQHQVSRKFLYQQADTAQLALESAFDPPASTEEVLFQLPVTKAWLRQLILSLVLTCHSSYRGVITLLDDLFDTPVSLGHVHNVVQSAVAGAREINRSYDLTGVRIGAHDEIFQAGRPVLVGVDTASTFCYLLSPEQHRDADTWGVRLLELTECGFAPDAIVADFGSGLRAGQALALPEVPCRGDLFHVIRDWEQVVTFLENRAYAALETCTRRERQEIPERRRGRPAKVVDQPLEQVQTACNAAMALADEVRLLGEWLRQDVLSMAGPCYADRQELYDFIVSELAARVPLCAHRLGPITRLLKGHRAELLAFARSLDEPLDQMAQAWEVAPQWLRRLLQARCRDPRDPRCWAEESAIRSHLRGWYDAACRSVDALIAGTVRASSVVENLNSRLRTYFSLRRHLGADYLELLQFYLNHRVLERSERAERQGKTPAELLTGQPHAHWLELLGLRRFARPT
ncbi:MAG: hypothetical protein ACYCU7_18845 [Acidimicrobiales bacterium]